MARLKQHGQLWYIHFKTDKGWRKESTGLRDKQAASVRLAEFERAEVDPHRAATQAATLRQAVDEYYSSRESLARSDATLQFIRQKASQLLRILPPRLSDISHRVCLAYIDQRMAEGRQRLTAVHELSVLRAALRLANRNGLMAVAPESIIPVLGLPYRPRTRVLTKREARLLLGVLDETRTGWVAFALATGARLSEVDRAQRGDVRRGMVRIRGLKTNAANAKVPLTRLTRWLLRDYPRPPYSKFGNITRDLKDACKRAGIKPVTPNDLRRTFITWHVKAGVPLDVVRRMARHTSVAMLERHYAHLVPSDLKRLANILPTLRRRGDSNP